MNERIKELIKQSSETKTSYFDGRGNVTETYFDRYKFTELIVRECVWIMYHYNALHKTGEYKFTDLLDAVKQYFGIQE